VQGRGQNARSMLSRSPDPVAGLATEGYGHVGAEATYRRRRVFSKRCSARPNALLTDRESRVKYKNGRAQ
jgi:hypothetical protein